MKEKLPGVADILIDILAGITEETIKKMREAGPEERRSMAQLFSEMLDLSTELLKESPELRRAFSRAHAEFLKYPQCAGTIRQALEAYKEFGSAGEDDAESRKTH
ncbi:MAG: hypothetical protein K6T65_08940 [Peptococcaceae bacterium]|nr:hypothetical protein [Peptococcaceae bacterium]